MKIDQIAYYCATDEISDGLKIMFGLQGASWIRDKATGESSVHGSPSQINIALLQFNYDLGIELEIIRYIRGPHWHQERIHWQKPFISHVGIHLDDGEDFPEMFGKKLVQETFTVSHTSEYLTTGPGKGRLYHYRIYELGVMNFLKYIKRVNP